ncbi:citrate/2-methylcitrate synthase, partial [bacterium]|nr:citrate/2-methylcitrate synthase [bacterium]
VQDLADLCSFEEVAYLIWNGELPNKAQLAAFEKMERSNRAISDQLLSVIRLFPKQAHPMDTVRTGVSYLGMEDADLAANCEAEKWSDPKANYEKSVRLMAKIPTIIAADYRCRKGKAPIAPKPELTFSQNFFHMCFGEVPPPEVIKAFDVSLILYAEHGFNASTFTARVVTSTLSDIYSAVVAGIGSLKGPLHGGANEQVMHVLKEIESPSRAKEWMLTALKEKRKIMGFGHRVYKNFDPRATIIKKTCDKVLNKLGIHDPLLDIAHQLEEVALKDPYFIEKKLYPNVDFYSGIIYKAMCFPVEMFTVLFAIGRMPGWIAQWKEMMESKETRIGRPRQIYTGFNERKYTSISKRG